MSIWQGIQRLPWFQSQWRGGAWQSTIGGGGGGPSGPFFAYGSAGNNSYFAKYDPSDGSVIWSKNDGTERVNSISIDLDGNLIVANQDNSIRKYSPDGSTIWTLTEGSAGNQIRANGAAVLSDGSIVVFFQSDFVKKYSKDGNTTLWTVTDPDFSTGNDLVVDADDDIYLSTTKFDGENVTIHLIKYDLDGNVVFDKSYSSTLQDLAVMPGPKIYAHDTDTIYEIDINNGNRTSFYTDPVGIRGLAVSADGFIYAFRRDSGNLTKFKQDGTIVWDSSLPNPDSNYNVNEIAIDANGDPFLLVNSSQGDRALKLDSDGNIEWNVSIPSFGIQAAIEPGQLWIARQ